MPDLSAIPASPEARERVMREAAREGMTPAQYLETLLTGGKVTGGKRTMTTDGNGGTDYFGKMKEMAELAPMLMLMKSMGLNADSGNGGPLTRRDLEELLSKKRRGGEEDDEEESPMARRINKMMMRRLDLQMYLKLLGDDSTEGKYVKELMARQEEEMKALKDGQTLLQRDLHEEREKNKEERLEAELARKDEVLQSLRQEIAALSNRIESNSRPDTPSFGAQVRELATSLISAKQAFSEAESGLRGPASPPKDGDNVDKIGYFLDKGASAAKDILQGLGYVQAGQHGVSPQNLGHVPVPPAMEEVPSYAPPSPPMSEDLVVTPVAPVPPPPPVTLSPPEPEAVSPSVSPVLSAEPVYLDNTGTPISKQQWEKLTAEGDG